MAPYFATRSAAQTATHAVWAAWLASAAVMHLADAVAAGSSGDHPSVLKANLLFVLLTVMCGIEYVAGYLNRAQYKLLMIAAWNSPIMLFWGVQPIVQGAMAARQSPMLLFWISQPMAHVMFGGEHRTMGMMILWVVQPILYAVWVGDGANPRLHPLWPVQTIIGFGWPFALNIMYSTVPAWQSASAAAPPPRPAPGGGGRGGGRRPPPGSGMGGTFATREASHLSRPETPSTAYHQHHPASRPASAPGTPAPRPPAGPANSTIVSSAASRGAPFGP